MDSIRDSRAERRKRICFIMNLKWIEEIDACIKCSFSETQEFIESSVNSEYLANASEG